VSDAALTSLVKELRRVLPRGVIRTVHAVGYAFDATPLTEAQASGMHWLVGPTRRYALHDGVNIIGRERSADVRLEPTGVSRRHARITVTNDRAVIEDLGSTNGTVVGGRPASPPIELEDGDAIRAGDVELVYRRQSAAESTATIAGA
jgi:hypothetical protein